MIYTIKTETAELIRNAAKLNNLQPVAPVMAGPGLETLELPGETGEAFEAGRKAAKVSADAFAARLARKLIKGA